jgi:hypothetical protein
MFLIFGLRTKSHVLGRAAAPCHVCGQSGTVLVIKESTKFSLFFIPLIPVRTKYVAECQNGFCRSRTRLSKGEANRLLAGVAL